MRRIKRQLSIILAAAMMTIGLLGATAAPAAAAGPCPSLNTWCSIVVNGRDYDAGGNVIATYQTTYSYLYTGTYWYTTAPTHSCSTSLGWACAFDSGITTALSAQTADGWLGATYHLWNLTHSVFPMQSTKLTKNGITAVDWGAYPLHGFWYANSVLFYSY